MAQIIKHVRNQMPRPAKDERGITLQTLIVTAVLVLMAVAAGVIIAAITNSSSDDLEEQSQDLDALCAPWELHDPVLEANAAGGGGPYINGRVPARDDRDRPLPDVLTNPGRGGVTSSKIGCLPVCYLTLNDDVDKTLDDVIQPTGMRSSLSPLSSASRPATQPDNYKADEPFESEHLKFDTTNRPPKRISATEGEVRIGVVYGRRQLPGIIATELGRNDKLWNRGQITRDQISNPQQVGTVPPLLVPNSKLVIRVSDDKEGCVIEDTSSGKPEIRMKSTR